jgi:hemerythrin-like domain-containing protein
MNIGDKPDSGFDDPLGLLSDCHRRIEHFLGVLRRVLDTYAGAAMTPAHAATFEKALDYFREAAPRHTADEEESLFPRMRQGAQPLQDALQRLEHLEGEHREADAAHARVDALGRQWLRDGTLRTESVADLDHLLIDLEVMYATHIKLEDDEIFPLARAHLQPEVVADVGREMAQRRGLYPQLGDWFPSA